MSGSPPGVQPVRLVVIAAVCAAVLVAVGAMWAIPDGAAVSGYTQTATGPVGPADRDLLVKVKQAGLWEMPAGSDLTDRAADQRVREIGGKISAEHHELDRIVDEAAAEVGVTLPTQATTEQQSWVARIAADPDPDRLGVNLLRQAHGKVLPVIVAVRVGTRNTTIRTFADQAATYVARHIGYLESTGLVDYAALPEAPAPLPNPSPVKSSYYAALDRPTLALAGLAIVVVVAVAIRAAWPRRRAAATVSHHPRHGRRRRRR